MFDLLIWFFFSYWYLLIRSMLSVWDCRSFCVSVTNREVICSNSYSRLEQIFGEWQEYFPERFDTFLRCPSERLFEMTNFSGISAALLPWHMTQLPDVSVIIGERERFVKPLRFFLSKRSPHEAQTLIKRSPRVLLFHGCRWCSVFPIQHVSECVRYVGL